MPLATPDRARGCCRRSRARCRNCPRRGSQPRRRNTAWIGSSSSRAASRARSMRLGESRPSPKKRWLSDTQPICRLSSSSGSKRSPMMISVLPPPMSTTSRRPGFVRQVVRHARVDQARLLHAGDDLDRETRALRARARGTPACGARRAAHWCPRPARCGHACRAAAGRNARRQASARAAASLSIRPSSPTPAARRTISRRRSMMTSWPCE